MAGRAGSGWLQRSVAGVGAAPDFGTTTDAPPRATSWMAPPGASPQTPPGMATEGGTSTIARRVGRSSCQHPWQQRSRKLCFALCSRSVVSNSDMSCMRSTGRPDTSESDAPTKKSCGLQRRPESVQYRDVACTAQGKKHKTAQGQKDKYSKGSAKRHWGKKCLLDLGCRRSPQVCAGTVDIKKGGINAVSPPTRKKPSGLGGRALGGKTRACRGTRLNRASDTSTAAQRGRDKDAASAPPHSTLLRAPCGLSHRPPPKSSILESQGPQCPPRSGAHEAGGSATPAAHGLDPRRPAT